MTVIVALKDMDKGITYIGGDGRRQFGNVIVPLSKKEGKVFVSGGLVFGHTGMAKIRNITRNVQFRFKKGYPKLGFNLEDMLMTHLIPKFKSYAKEKGYLSEEKGIPSMGGTVLVAIGTQICIIHSDFSVTPIEGLYTAIGSGQQVALGALQMGVIHSNLTPRKLVNETLKICGQHINSVGPPYIVKTTKILGK